MVEDPNSESREGVEMKKERVPKEDGRYIIFYTFGDETEEEDGEG